MCDTERRASQLSEHQSAVRSFPLDQGRTTLWVKLGTCLSAGDEAMNKMVHRAVVFTVQVGKAIVRRCYFK